MKHRIPRNAVVVAAAAALFLAGTLSQGQAPVPEDAALRQLATDVLTQNRAIADNQTKIEERLTQLAETIRQARIFASRSGRGAQ